MAQCDLSLPTDCLLLILDELPRQSDVAAMMRASKALYSAGILPLLRFGVTITSEFMIPSLAQFISADLSTRAVHIRRMVFSIPWLCKDTEDGGFHSLIQDALTATIAMLPVIFFIFRLNEFQLDDIDSEESAYEDDDDKLALDAFRSLHHDTVLCRFAAACPQLKYVSLDIMGATSLYWEIHRSDAGADLTLVKLDPIIWRELVRSEGFVLQ